ncbi:response regulator [Geobacter pelophilus]|jgi:CheY-like chemotaxis protein|uniref:Response regulator n=1 Tax=Geoanaerobacter pelophilus TaxID=60036 RepID=A0AAW4L0W7_9BACT|nr:response regulator [Geoanaerobacter pelophilus]MBT0664606.1 response regulator [Geoanaerobacter pelophilus]
MNAPIRVLIIDDDELVRESISAFLEDDGFWVESAASAEEALTKLETANYDLCLTDYSLPGMDGESLILRANEASPATRFIMHSGVSFAPSDELLQIGFSQDNVMSKPIIRLELLSEKIKKLAGKAGESE